jgi:hypothetical protein
LNTSEERIAPHLPQAAERPWAVARMRVGYDSAATTTRKEKAGQSSPVDSEPQRTGGGISTKVEEELEEGEACEEGAFSDTVDFTGEDTEEQGGHGEAHKLDILTAKIFDGEEGNVVAGKESKSRDNDLKGMRSVQPAGIRVETRTFPVATAKSLSYVSPVVPPYPM